MGLMTDTEPRKKRRLQPSDPDTLEEIAEKQHAQRGTQAVDSPGRRIDVSDTVHYIMDRLEPEEREILRLVADFGTSRQAAEQLGITPTAAGVRLRSARAHARKIILRSQ